MDNLAFGSEFTPDGTTRAESLIVELLAPTVAHAAVEWPPRVRVIFDDGRVAHIGRANGQWQVDVYADYKHEGLATLPTEVWTVPTSHHGTATGIVRWITGQATGNYARKR